MTTHANGRRVAIVAGLRTPFCKAGTDLSSLTAQQLAGALIGELVTRSEIDPRLIDSIVFGNVVPTIAAPNVAREVVLSGDLPRTIHGATVMRACASGTEATANAANAIALGQIDVAVVGGVDCLSDVPIQYSRRFAAAVVAASKARSLADKLKLFGKLKPRDLLPVPPAPSEPSTGKTMGQHADAMAKQNAISRLAQDQFALRSHQLAAAAVADGRIGAEVTPVFLPDSGAAVTRDNGIRADATLEALQKLRPVFDRNHGTVTAGNSCPLTDGASALLLMAAERARELGLHPLGFVGPHAFAAVDPQWQLLIGPLFAISRLLDRSGLALRDFDLIDLHEAFAAQVLSCLKAIESRTFAEQHLGRSAALGRVDLDRFNVMGGSIAIGHPFAATAGRQIITMVNELRRRGQQRGLVAQCAAGGMAAAISIEAA
ncbi:MAG: acetyl-CoA C-acyltransferase [Deltaproteobacteria bacterium]|nr:acetyl-CoA C-acyltransferase [Deltaproteobacteria bacterium]